MHAVSLSWLKLHARHSQQIVPREVEYTSSGQAFLTGGAKTFCVGVRVAASAEAELDRGIAGWRQGRL